LSALILAVLRNEPAIVRVLTAGETMMVALAVRRPKVRDNLTSYDDPGRYDHPVGTVADLATSEELRADGIRVAT
jgi:hypothetical protein